MTAPDFWSNRERAQAEVEEVSRLRSLINPFRELERDVGRFRSAAATGRGRNRCGAARARRRRKLISEHARLIHKLEEFELRQFLSGENDRSNAFITIHSGAGGTESCDWADMLLRMYQRWIERSGFKSQTIDIQTGEEVGIKSATLSGQRRIRLRISQHRTRCASARAHLALRREQAAAHFFRQRRCRPGNRGLSADRNQSRRSSRSTLFAPAAKAGRT